MRSGIARFASVLLTAATLLGAVAVPALADTPVLSPSAQVTSSSDSIAAVAAAAKPSVVGILTTTKGTGTQKGRAAGTGWVYKPGVIITNAHVVEDATEVKVLYPDQTVETVSTDNVFSDKTADIAVIKVSRTDLKPLAQGDSDKVVVGQTVIAVGNPLGFRLGNSVTAGILSGTGRAIGSGYPFLQADVAINPGNSGGPLFNTKGEVIGINSAKMADIGVEGLAFAIPINTAKQIAETLLKEGKVERATMGLEFDEGWEAYFGVPNTEGVTIANVISDGPAGLTALSAGDKVMKLDDTKIYTVDDIYSFLLSKKPGDRVTITVKRRGQILSVTITLASQDALRKIAEEPGVEKGGILFGLTASQIQDAAEYGKSLSRGYVQPSRDYVAVSGNDYAVLYTEYLYVARRISSAYEFGFTPGVGFQQAVAKEIRDYVEIQFEMQTDLHGATFTLQQGDKVKQGVIYQDISTTTSDDGTTTISVAAVRFNTVGLSSTDDLKVTVTTKDGKTSNFKFTIKDLR